MSFTTITYNFYCTVSVFILSGYPHSASVRSRGWTYIKVRLCINQLYDPYIWRTLFWYFAVDKETTFTLTLAPQSRQNPRGIFFSYASFEFTGEHSEKTLPQEALRICSCLCLHSVPYRSYLMSRPIRVYIRFQKEEGLEPSWSLKHTCSNFNASLNN